MQNMQKNALAINAKKLRDPKLRKLNSERMKTKNPMFSDQTKQKVSQTLKLGYQTGKFKSCFSDPIRLAKVKENWKITPEGSRSISERMKKKNPMCVQKYKDKMVETFRTKIKNGLIVYKRGIDHHLWKGNRTFADSVRIQLYPLWTKLVLKRDGFSCTQCSATNKLQVHHVKPLRKFIDNIKKKYKIQTFLAVDPKLWQPYIDEIIAKHKLIHGVTVCTDCHKKIDPLFRNFYGNSKPSEKKVCRESA